MLHQLSHFRIYGIYEKKFMIKRCDKNSQRIIKIASNLATNKKYKSSAQMMSKAGLSELIIDRILFEPHNVRKTDLE